MSQSVQAARGGERRNRTIQLAVLTSILSKMGTVFLRLISIPIAIRVLGIEEFGVYVTITMVVSLIDILHVGLGPALTQGISKAVAAGDRRREQAYFSTGLMLSAGLTVGIASIGCVGLQIIPITTLFGQQFEPYADSVYRACWIAIIIITIELVCMVIEKARDGYLETRYNNAWGAAGNFVGAAMVFIGIRFFPTIEFLVIAINGSVALAKVSNSVHFLLFQRRYLIPRFSCFQRTLVKPLLRDGILFSAAGLNMLAEYSVVGFLVSRLISPVAAATYAVMITVHFSLTGLVQMVTIPTWPAIIDARERGEIDWIRKAVRRLNLLGIGFGVAAGISLVALGPWALPLWAGDEFHIERVAILAFAVYFAIHIWRHMHQMFVQGLGHVGMVARVVTTESIVVIGTTLLVIHFGGGLAAVYSGICFCLAALGGWMLPVFYRRQLEALRPVAAHAVPASAVKEAARPESTRKIGSPSV